MADYYSERLSAERLRKCYEVAPPRVQRYLQAELDYTLSLIEPGDIVLELGCGYGRVLVPLAGRCRIAVGIDTSLASLALARQALGGRANGMVLCMDAAHLGIRDNVFDVVICIQNGISAFHVDRRRLLEEGLRVTKPGGLALYSTYSDRFWSDRLEWFEIQAEAGLLGKIDHERTGHGEIVCRDGFTATTVGAAEFAMLADGLGAAAGLTEIDESSLFCHLRKPERF